MPASAQTTIDTIAKDHQGISFKPGRAFMYSPTERAVIYQRKKLDSPTGLWSLFHELGHAKLDHVRFGTDIELVKMECDAWEKAKQIAREYDVLISEDHIQACLDTYRDWLQRRSMCPDCSIVTIQNRPGGYHCYNCGLSWTVSSSQLCIEQSRV